MFVIFFINIIRLYFFLVSLILFVKLIIIVIIVYFIYLYMIVINNLLIFKFWYFLLLVELMVDKVMELKYIGGVYGGNVKLLFFLCLVLKMF